MGTQEFYANVDLKGNQLKNVVVDVVTELPTTDQTAGRIVSKGGVFYVYNDTKSKWVEMADASDVTTLSGTVSGHTTKIEKLEEAVGTDGSGNNLISRVTTLEGTVGKKEEGATPATGLCADVAANTTSIETHTSDIKTLEKGLETANSKITTNSGNITTLQTDLGTANGKIKALEDSVGTASDTARADGTVYARIAKNVADIGTLNAAVGDGTSGLTKDVADLKSGKVDKDGSKVLSTNDYTTAEKDKLGAIAEGAQVNVIETVNVKDANGTTALTPSADKAVTIDVSGFALKTDIASAYKAMGSVPFANLPSGLGEGDAGKVYNVTDSFSDNGKTYPAGTNVLWTGTEWDPLAGYTDFSVFAVKSEVTTALNGKQDTLTDAQKNAVNSGITSDKVTAYEGYADSIATAQSTANEAKTKAEAAVIANSAITGATACKVTYDSKGLVTKGEDLVASDIPFLDTSKITSGTFVTDRIPVKLVSKDAKLSKSDTVNVASGLNTVFLAQVLSGGKVIFVDTTISAGTVTLGTASEELDVMVNMVGLSS